MDESHVGATVIPGLINSEELLASVEPYDPSKEYLGPLIYGGYRLTVMGPMGQGKTSLLMEMAAAVVTGRDFLGFHGRGDARVAYINTEMGDEQMAQAIRDANASHPSLDVISRRFKFDTSNDDKRLVFEIAQRYDVVFIDPWYQFVEKPQEDYTLAGRTAEYMTRLQAGCPETAFVIGTHSHEPTGNQKLSLSNILGYKQYHWNADTILMMQRVAPDVSKIGWEKVRSAEFDRYGVKLKGKWTVTWERGKGFTRAEQDKQPTAAEVVLGAITREWVPKSEVMERTGLGHSSVAHALSVLVATGKLESSGGSGRGSLKFWRLVDPNQGVLDGLS
jgi:hypothetical protein